jgi:hypothetical protein
MWHALLLRLLFDLLPPATDCLPSCSNLPEADSAIQQLFELALGTLRQAGATLVEDFVIQGNSYGQDWDAARGGQGPAIGESGSCCRLVVAGGPAGQPACCSSLGPELGARRCSAAPTLTALPLPLSLLQGTGM